MQMKTAEVGPANLVLDGTEKPLNLAMEDKSDQVRQLINLGKERGYLLYDELNAVLPAEVHSSDEIDDLLSTIERYGIDIHEDVSSAKVAPGAAEAVEHGDDAPKEEGPVEEAELDLTPGALEKTKTLCAFTCGRWARFRCSRARAKSPSPSALSGDTGWCMKTISRSPDRIKELLAIGEELAQGTRSIKEIVQFDEEELTEEKIEKKTRQTLKNIDKIAKLYAAR